MALQCATAFSSRACPRALSAAVSISRNCQRTERKITPRQSATQIVRELSTTRLVASSRPSRSREIEAACGNLAESVQAGDPAWFERIVNQLRGVLEETGSTSTSTKDSAHFCSQGSDNAGTATSSKASPAPAPLSSASSSHAGPQRRFSPVPSAPIPSENANVAEAVQDESEPAWMEALRLLEAAAHSTTGAPVRQATVENPGWREEDELPTEQAALPDTDEQITRYIDSFGKPAQEGRFFVGDSPHEPVSGGQEVSQMGPSDDGMQPEWARALRILELSVPELVEAADKQTSASQAQLAEEHVQETSRTDRMEQLLSRTDPAADEHQSLRMKRYAELLQENDSLGNLAPGASVPRFSQLVGKQRASTKVPLPPPPSASATVSTNSAPKQPAPPQPLSSTPSAKSAVKSAAQEPASQATGRGNLISSIPASIEDVSDDAVLRKEDMVWSEHEFNDGEKENKRVLKKFTKEFKQMAADTPDGLRDPKLLTAALDLALACVKCYELDKADKIYRRCIGECRRRGMPWDVKCIQDMATLRCKQHRQADAAELLEELAGIAPPHPATFINLGTVYNQLRQYDKAETWFLQAVNFKGGVPGREDRWNLGICKKNQGKYKDALPMLETALAEFQEHEPEHPVTIAKLHSSVGGCLHEMGRYTEAAEQYSKARELYLATVGTHSPLFCSAAEGLAKALKVQCNYFGAFDALLESFKVHAIGDAVHPTPLFEHLEMALELHDLQPDVELNRFKGLIDSAIANLETRGLANDGNAGLVMSRSGKLLSRLEQDDSRRQAAELVSRGKDLIQKSHDAGEANLTHEIMEAETMLKRF